MEMSGSRINQKEKHRIKIEKELWLFLATIKHDEYCQATLFKMTCSHSPIVMIMVIMVIMMVMIMMK